MKTYKPKQKYHRLETCVIPLVEKWEISSIHGKNFDNGVEVVLPLQFRPFLILNSVALIDRPFWAAAHCVVYKYGTFHNLD